MVFAPVKMAFTECREIEILVDMIAGVRGRYARTNLQQNMRKKSKLTIVDSVCPNPSCACISIVGAQRFVYLNVDIHPIGVIRPLHASTLSDTQFRATQGMLQTGQRIVGVRWIKVMSVIMIGVVVIGVVVIEVVVVVIVVVFKERTASLICGAPGLLGAHAARPRGRIERFGSADPCLVDWLEQSACERESDDPQ